LAGPITSRALARIFFADVTGRDEVPRAGFAVRKNIGGEDTAAIPSRHGIPEEGLVSAIKPEAPPTFWRRGGGEIQFGFRERTNGCRSTRA
jgi:hypothetical protein